MTLDRTAQAATALVRLALCNEYGKGNSGLKKEDIVKYCFPNGESRSADFDAVFASAQDQLQRVFGLELTLVPASQKKHVKSLADKRQAITVSTQNTNSNVSASKKSWMLTLVEPNPLLGTDDVHDAKLAITLAMLALNGKKMDRNEYYSILFRYYSIAAEDIPEALWIKQRYIERINLNNNNNMSEVGSSVELHLGVRAMVEWPAKRLAKFVAMIVWSDDETFVGDEREKRIKQIKMAIEASDADAATVTAVTETITTT